VPKHSWNESLKTGFNFNTGESPFVGYAYIARLFLCVTQSFCSAHISWNKARLLFTTRLADWADEIRIARCSVTNQFSRPTAINSQSFNEGKEILAVYGRLNEGCNSTHMTTPANEEYLRVLIG
jgi:hypothetical protein